MKNPNFTLCIASGMIAYALFVASGVAGGNFTPMSPDMSATDVVAYYQAHLTGIRIAAVFFLISPAFFIAFCAAITAEIKRIEGPSSPLAWSQFAIGVFVVLPFFPAAVFWTAAAFRLDRPAEITQALNDVAWLFNVMPGAPAAFQPILIGFAILIDRNQVKVFPRWLAYFNFLTGIVFMFGCFAGFTKTGWFAWNGVMPFWLPTFIFTAWIPVMSYMLWRNDKARPAYRPAGNFSNGG
jgi:hypothetical protein